MLRKSVFFIVAVSVSALPLLAQSGGFDGGNTGSYFSEPQSSSCPGGNCELSPGSGSTCNPAFQCTEYFSVFGGAVDIDNFERKILVGNNTQVEGAKFRDDWAWGAAIGRQVDPHGRVEFEFTFRDTPAASWFVQEFDPTGVLLTNDFTPATGDLQTYSGMVNIVFDLYQRTAGCAGLYLGAGLGALYVDTDIVTATESFASHDTSFAYQFIGGVNYALTQRVDLFGEFRYLGADYINVDNLTTGVSLGDFSIDTNNIFFGVRVRR